MLGAPGQADCSSRMPGGPSLGTGRALAGRRVDLPSEMRWAAPPGGRVRGGAGRPGSRAGRPRHQRGPSGAESGLMVCGGRLLFAGWMTGRRQPGGDVSGEPARRWPSLPPAAAGCFYFDITLGGRGGGCAAWGGAGGRRGSCPASLVQPLAAGGRWALRAPLPTCRHSSPLPPWQGRTRWDALRKAAGLSSKTLPRDLQRRGHTRSTHARTRMPARPHPIRLQSHGHMYIRAHPLAHGVDGHPQAGGLGHT